MKRTSRRKFLGVVASTGVLSGISLNSGKIVAADKPELEWPEHVQDFPALTVDDKDVFWLTYIERPMPQSVVHVDRVKNGRRTRVCKLETGKQTGVAAPAIAPLANGCVVAFPIEQNDKWQIAYAFVQAGQSPDLKVIESDGTSNISPAIVTTGSKAFILWESNAGSSRGIYAARVSADRFERTERLTTEKWNSYNPTVTITDKGDIFAAWDSVRDGNANIYGAWHKGSTWESEKQITSDSRLERHPCLTSRNNEIWMAWQVQSYKGRRLNGIYDQKIVIAQMTRNGWQAPVDLFDNVSTSDRLLLRPRIAFDATGRLWLTARRSIAQNSGWHPLVWSYSDKKWTAPKKLVDHQGRWRPVPFAFGKKESVFVAQFDDLPEGWDHTRGKYRDWRSGLFVNTFKENESAQVQVSTKAMVMPKTDFSVSEKIKLCSADLPRQKVRVNGKDLYLYWGDFHDHTDISVCQRNTNPPGHDLYANERDIEKLDFCAITDHGYNYDPQQWAFSGEQTRNNHDPGRFVTFLGEEWTSSNAYTSGGFGHRNLVFLDPYHPSFYDAMDDRISPQDLWNEIGDADFICIPHQLADWKHNGKGNPPTDWNFIHEKYQPVAEIFQTRESYEYLGCPRQARDGVKLRGSYLQDVWATQKIIGVIASPDHGGGRGKVAVWAEELTRQAIFDAVRARHTYGTSGAKMALFFGSENAIMGDVMQGIPKRFVFNIKALAMHDIKELVIFRNNKIVYKVEPGKKEFETQWVDQKPLKDEPFIWYYSRIHSADDELAWSSPIWFKA